METQGPNCQFSAAVLVWGALVNGGLKVMTELLGGVQVTSSSPFSRAPAGPAAERRLTSRNSSAVMPVNMRHEEALRLLVRVAVAVFLLRSAVAVELLVRLPPGQGLGRPRQAQGKLVALGLHLVKGR